MKKLFAMLMVLALVLGSAAMAEELSYDGQVVAGETVPVAAPFGGRMGEVKLRAGDPVAAGDTLDACRESVAAYAAWAETLPRLAD